MWQNSFMGNTFQISMEAKFNIDITSMSAIMMYVIGKEELVIEYIRNMATLFPPTRYGLGNPSGIYSNYEPFRRHFIKYWRNALQIPREASEKLGEIFDEEVCSQESIKNMAVSSVYFENGKALTAGDCLDAVYEVLKESTTNGMF